MKYLFLIIFYLTVVSRLLGQDIKPYFLGLSGSYNDLGNIVYPPGTLITNRSLYIIEISIERNIFTQQAIGLDYKLMLNVNEENSVSTFSLSGVYFKYQLVNFDKFRWHILGGGAASDIRFSGSRFLEHGLNYYYFYGSGIDFSTHGKIRISFGFKLYQSIAGVDKRLWPPILYAGLIYPFKI